MNSHNGSKQSSSEISLESKFFFIFLVRLYVTYQIELTRNKMFIAIQWRNNAVLARCCLTALLGTEFWVTNISWYGGWSGISQLYGSEVYVCWFSSYCLMSTDWHPCSCGSTHKQYSVNALKWNVTIYFNVSFFVALHNLKNIWLTELNRM